jgi:hypothetical protein
MVTAGDRATTRQAGRQGGSGGTVASDPTRRAILAATAALPLLAAGCNGVGALASPPRPGPDVALLRDAISAEELMVAGYQAAVSRLHVAGGSGAQARRAPGEAADLAVLVSSLLGQHQAHLSQLRMRLKVPAGSPYPSASERRGAPPPRLPAGPPRTWPTPNGRRPRGCPASCWRHRRRWPSCWRASRLPRPAMSRP